MSYIEWNDGLKLNLKIIDAEHERLIEMINELHEVSQERDDPRLRSVFKELSDYTNTHFTVEEEFMRVYEYSDLLSHKDLHGSFKKRIQSMEHSLDEGGLDLPNSLMLYLKDWLTHHILKVDKHLTEYLNSKGVY